MIQDSLKNRKHVVDYSTTIIPTREEINNILATAYPLVTSKQKGYPYQVHILGPNKSRSKELWELCEGNKIDTDINALEERLDLDIDQIQDCIICILLLGH